MSDYQPPSPQANGNGSVYGSVHGSVNNGGFNSGGFSNSSILNGGFNNGGFNNGSVNNGSVVSPSIANRSRHGSRSSNGFGRIQTEAETKYPESRVLIIGTGGTICMQQTPDGLQPTSNFLENAMAPRPSFNDFGPKGMFSTILIVRSPRQPTCTRLIMTCIHHDTPPLHHNQTTTYTFSIKSPS